MNNKPWHCEKTGEKGTDYNAYLYTDWWKERKAQTMEEQGGKCQHCGSTERLEVHHLTYDNIGNERSEDLLLLCRNCHKALHPEKKKATKPKKKKKRRKSCLKDCECYAVAKGRIKGIFYSWKDCEAQVKGYANAKYKKCNNVREADKYVRQSQ